MVSAFFAMLLYRWKVNLALAFTCLCSWLLASGGMDPAGMLLAAGLYAYASGAAMLNHLQEKYLDAGMNRTRSRPLVTGKVSFPAGVMYVSTFTVLGLAMVGLAGHLHSGTLMVALWISLVSLMVYNAIYTPLKKTSLWAPLPGAVNGASPVLIGWAAGGGSFTDVRVWVLFLFMFVWQIPHFFLLLFRFGPEYERAGLAVVTSRIDYSRLVGVTYIWIIAAAIAALMFPVVGLVRVHTINLFLLLITAYLVLEFKKMLTPGWKDLQTSAAFRKINLFGLSIMSCVFFGHLIH